MLYINSLVIRRRKIQLESRLYSIRRLPLTPALPTNNLRHGHLRPGESVGVYLAAIKKLVILFGRLPERALARAFLAGRSPVGVKRFLRANSCVDSLALDELLDQARSIWKDDSALAEPIVAAAQANQCNVKASPGSGSRNGIVCYKYNGRGLVTKKTA